MRELNTFFNPHSVAVIGASREPQKIGHVVLKNFADNFQGSVYPVNPNADRILGLKCYISVRAIPHPVELAVIAVKADIVPQVLRECGQKKIKHAIIISGGFGEVGRHDLERELARISGAYGIRLIGPNCLGIFDARSNVDTLFLPRYRLQRPREGGISFVSQSGAVGSAVLDWAASEGFGVSKFISYGNALDVNETELLEYLNHDKKTRVICCYLEGVRDGRKFMDTASKATKSKPIIVIKGGRSEAGTEAVRSHTGSLAGSDAVYDAAFRQSGCLRANDVTEMFDFARALAEQPLPKGDRVQVITNGGGFGVLATDAIIENKLRLARMRADSLARLRSKLPEHAVVGNPLDLVGDADSERYSLALESALSDPNVDSVLCIILFQTTNVQSEIVDVISEFNDRKAKPLVACSAGGSYSKLHTTNLEKLGIPVYDSPHRAAKALWALTRYAQLKGRP
ncbi:CoA-binding protein [archaeon]|nr:CoA-binding protein [archaeon]